VCGALGERAGTREGASERDRERHLGSVGVPVRLPRATEPNAKPFLWGPDARISRPGAWRKFSESQRPNA